MSDFSNKHVMLFNDLPWSRWPEVLPKTPDDEALPLKVGIYDDLVALLPDDSNTRRAFRRAMGKYARSFRYLDAVASDNAMRHDIDGNTVGPVSELDRHSASLELYRRTVIDRAKARKTERYQEQTVNEERTQSREVPTPAASIRDRILNKGLK
ncbi:ProQ/FinO family protein [Microvirga aerilata]|uniref:ProQ/FinO family protein n=1 Tax=Microvirga aerilata TaxID=670292 RepID=A0A936ZA96_9HYPH|nr:ProQ/FinO family protein [Microvirga aerilata]MBL0407523.1 ProQ/FinO family protein [Microvirga aerilata]